MLWKPYRLRKNWQFQEIIKNGRKLAGSSFALFSMENKSENCLFGISIPQKLVKKAVMRNYYKRQVRNMLVFYLKKHNDNCQADSNHSHRSFVIIIRSAYSETDFSNNQEKLHKLLTLTFLKKN